MSQMRKLENTIRQLRRDRLRANTGHSPTAWRMAHTDPLLPFKIGRLNGRRRALSALSWRWKASPSGPREQAERLRTLDRIPVQHAGPLADQYVCCGVPDGPPAEKARLNLSHAKH